MAPRKTWAQKFDNGRKPEVHILEKNVWGMLAGSKLLIPTPQMVQDYVNAIPAASTRTIAEMRSDLAAKNYADGTCPLTTSIFLRIMAEASMERGDEVPFWRIVDENSSLAKKLSCGPDYIRERRLAESN